MNKYKMIDARLRRLCETKPSGKCNVPDSIHKAWKAGGKSRDDLRVLLEKFDFDKERAQTNICDHPTSENDLYIYISILDASVGLQLYI